MSKELTLTPAVRKPLSERLRDARGQGMTEYIIIVALIAIAAIGVVTIFGDNIRQLFAGSTDALAGKESKVQTREAGQAGGKRGLKDFTKGTGSGGGR